MKKIDYSLMFVTDERITDDKQFLDVLESSLKGGTTIVQLREKRLTTKLFYKRALAVKKLCTKYRTPLIINDSIDIALAINADGVHIGQKDLPVTVARKLLGLHKIIGLSISNEQQAITANNLDLDYIGLSPIFKTDTKIEDIDVPIGIEGLKKIKLISNKRIICIGGIDKNNIAILIQNGTDGIAVVSAISKANNPEYATIQLKKIICQTGMKK